MGNSIDSSGIITPNVTPTHSEVLDNENEDWLSANT